MMGLKKDEPQTNWLPDLTAPARRRIFSLSALSPFDFSGLNIPKDELEALEVWFSARPNPDYIMRQIWAGRLNITFADLEASEVLL